MPASTVRKKSESKSASGDAALYDVIVIGAGIAGLGATAVLAANRKRVLILEARDRIGGRVLTRKFPGWAQPVELGPEFVHGGNPALTAELRRAGMKRRPSPEAHWMAQDGLLAPAPDAFERIDAAMRGFGPSVRGSFADWVRRNRNQLSESDQKLLRGFVEGFEGAPVELMSARSLYEAAVAGEGEQSRPGAGGYGRLVESMRQSLPEKLVDIRLKTVVKAVAWRPGRVEVRAEGKSRWAAAAALITLPLGVLKQKPAQGGVGFEPPLRKKTRLLARLESGHTVRLVLRLRPDAWSRGPLPAQLRAGRGAGFGFIHSSARYFPVWWSAAPEPVLTAWMGGPAARAVAGRTPKQLAELAMKSLADLLRIELKAVRALVRDYRVHDWSADPFTRGSYSFSVAGLEDAPQRLAEPVADTLFFAGEATADPLELGTVHGALASGRRAARECLARS